MSFLKRGRKKDKRGNSGSGDVVAPTTYEQVGQLLPPNPDQASSYYQNVPAPRHSELSVSTPDIYTQYYATSPLTDTIPSRQPIPQMVSTPRKPKPYNKKRGLSSLFSRKKSNSLPQLVPSQGLPPVPPTPPTSAPNSHKIRYTPQLDQREFVDSSLYDNVEHISPIKRIPLRQPPPQLTVEDENAHYVYTSVVVDPVTGNKTSVRGYERPESRDTQVSTLSRDPDYLAPIPPPDAVTGAVTDSLSSDRGVPHPESREYYIERSSVRDSTEVPHSRRPPDRRSDYTQFEAATFEKSELSRQEHFVPQQQQQQQPQHLKRAAFEKERHEPTNKYNDPHVKRESRLTEKTDSYPTTYSSNHSFVNSFHPANRHEETQYKFVASGEGNGLLYPVGSVPKGQTSLSSRFTAVMDESQRRETIPHRSSPSDQLVAYLQERQVELESRLVELTEQNANLAAQVAILSQPPVPPSEVPADVTDEIASLRQECELLREMVQQPKREPPIEKLYKPERQNGKETNELKRIIYRLNVELSRYQSLYGEQLPTESTLPLQQLGEEHTPWLANTSHLSPLLAAYDEQLGEKSSLLREAQGRVSELERLAESLEDQNARLEREVQSRPHSDEWERSRQLVEGQKQEIDVISRELHAAKQELLQLRTRSSQEFHQSDEKISNLEREAEKYKSYLNSLKSKLESERRAHNSEYRSVKERLQQSQTNSGNECRSLQTKIREVSAVASKREAVLVEQRADISVLEGKNSVSLNSAKALRQKVAVLEREVETSRSNELTAQGYLQEVVSMVERTAVERDTYAQLASKYGDSSHINRTGSNSVKRKLDKLRERTRLETGLDAFGDEDSLNGSDKQSHQEEILHLKSLLENRDCQIVKLKDAKSSVEQSLDSIRLALPREDPESVL